MNSEKPKEIELQDNEIPEMISITVICRLCANQSDKLLSIFNEDSSLNDLGSKINLYLPVKISETDNLPVQCCWQCASTVLTWHNLFVTAVETDHRLRNCQLVSEKDLLENIYQDAVITVEQNAEVVPDADNSITAYCHRGNITEEEDKEPLKKQDYLSKKTESVTFGGASELDQFSSLTILKTDSFDDNLDSSNDFDACISTHLVRVGKNESSSEEKNAVAVSSFEYNCQICPRYYITEHDIVKHIKECHSDAPPVENHEIKSEPREKAKDENKVQTRVEFTCQFCSKVYVSEAEIVNHLKECHSSATQSDNSGDQKLPEIKTQLRDKRKMQKLDQEVVNAAKVVVDGRVYYNCKVCGKSLHSPYTYIWHMRIHSGERPYICDLCGKQFRVSQGLVRHLKETHAKIKNFPCDICGRMFATRRNVEEHRRIHTNERPYICDLCGKAFKQKASLFVHNRSHSDTYPYKCVYCDQGFRSKPPLLIHITRHTGEKPFPCPICGRHFRIKYELKRHMLIHSDYKPFSCTICGMSFRQKRYLRNHNKQNHPQLEEEGGDKLKTE